MVGSVVHAAGAGLGTRRDLHRAARDVTLPRGIDGNYFVYVRTDATLFPEHVAGENWRS